MEPDGWAPPKSWDDWMMVMVLRDGTVQGIAVISRLMLLLLGLRIMTFNGLGNAYTGLREM
jgi:hypothetical protein